MILYFYPRKKTTCGYAVNHCKGGNVCYECFAKNCRAFSDGSIRVECSEQNLPLFLERASEIIKLIRE